MALRTEADPFFEFYRSGTDTHSNDDGPRVPTGPARRSYRSLIIALCAIVIAGVLATTAWIGYRLFSSVPQESRVVQRLGILSMSGPVRLLAGQEGEFVFTIANPAPQPLVDLSVIFQTESDFRFVSSSLPANNTANSFWRFLQLNGFAREQIRIRGKFTNARHATRTTSATLYYHPNASDTEYTERVNVQTAIESAPTPEGEQPVEISTPVSALIGHATTTIPETSGLSMETSTQPIVEILSDRSASSTDIIGSP